MVAEGSQHSEESAQLDAMASGLWTAAMAGIAGLVSLVASGRVFVAVFDSHTTDLPAHLTLGPSTIESTGWAYTAFYHAQAWMVVSASQEDRLVAAGLMILGAVAFVRGALLSGLLFITTGNRLVSLLVSGLLGLAISFPIPWLEVNDYLGTLPPNVWHTATQFVANTFAPVAVFALTLWWAQPGWRTARIAAVGGAVSALAKPALTPSWIAGAIVTAALIVALKKAALWSIVGQLAFMAALPIASVVYQSAVVFGEGAARHTALRPFVQWQYFTSLLGGDDTVVLSLARSLAFPLAVLLTLAFDRGRRADLFRWLIPAWSVLMVAVLVFALLDEVDSAGASITHGNFAWGAIAANSALYLMSAVALLSKTSLRNLPALAILSVQAMAGVAYSSSMITSNGYFL